MRIKTHAGAILGSQDPRLTPGPCGAVGERAHVILVWVRAPSVGNASHPWKIGCTRVSP